MEKPQLPADDTEQQWIAKYRQAIEATAPVQYSRITALQKKAFAAYELVVASVARLFQQLISIRSPKVEAPPNLGTVRIGNSKLHVGQLKYGPAIDTHIREKAS
jgi:hypothetical protein